MDLAKNTRVSQQGKGNIIATSEEKTCYLSEISIFGSCKKNVSLWKVKTKLQLLQNY